MTFVIVLVVFLFLALAVAGVAFVYIRKIYREQKNYERGLKMVPLMIHLPPLSDDVAAGGRDERDVADENISKAQILYNILASTAQKGFKSRYYGQRHIALEIVAQNGFVHFYTAVPVALVNVVEQAIISAYPTAQLEEVAEHNVFSPVGKVSGTMGGEINLKEHFAFPVATYQDLKRDPMQSLLNSLSALEKEDGAGIQILLRPAYPSWRKTAHSEADKKRKGVKKRGPAGEAGWWFSQVFTALIKPPENRAGDGDKPEKPLSGADQSVVEAIEDKTRHAGYEVLIRVITSSNISQRAQKVLNNIVATFALFDAPGKNGFKYVPAKDIDSFITAYILRFFPQEQNMNVLNTVELATLFHFPDQGNIPTSQLERQASKQVDGPRNISEDGLLLGYNVFRGAKKAIRIDLNDRRRHMYLVGQTGTGKSTMMENMALQDMLAGRGFAFVDPHGDTVDRLLAMVPRERTEDVIYFNPADMDYPLGLNMFEFQNPDQKDFLIQESINMLYKLYDPQHTGIIGPRYEHWFRNAALTLMADPGGSTFIDIPNVFQDNRYMRQKLQYVTDETVLDFWNKEMAQTSDYHKSEVLGWFVSKFGAFRSNEMMRNIIGQTKSAFNLRQVMDEGKILLVNLSKGRSGELNSKLLGMIFVMKFQAAAMSRADVLEDERKDFCLYVDEFQNYSTDSVAEILSEARKYRLNLIVGNQFTTQLSDQIRDAVFGNVGTIIAHRVGTADAEALKKVFDPVFDENDLERMPNFNSVVRMLIGGVPAQPFSMANLPQLGTPNPQLAIALKQLSAAKYGKPKNQVETEIFERLRSSAPAQAESVPSGFPSPPSRQTTSTPPKKANTFLDEWLAKRKAVTPAPPAPANPSPVAVPAGEPPVPAKPVATPNASTVPTEPKATEALEPEPTEPEPEAEQAPRPQVRHTEHQIKLNDSSLQQGDGVHIYIDKDGNISSDDPAETSL